MSLVLSVLGAIAALAGISTIGFGIPINEFSLGNTLILAGTTILAAGLVLLGLAAAVAQLKRIEVALSPRAIPRPARRAELAASAGDQAGRVPTPTRTRADAASPQLKDDEPASPAVERGGLQADRERLDGTDAGLPSDQARLGDARDEESESAADLPRLDEPADHGQATIASIAPTLPNPDRQPAVAGDLTLDDGAPLAPFASARQAPLFSPPAKDQSRFVPKRENTLPASDWTAPARRRDTTKTASETITPSWRKPPAAPAGSGIFDAMWPAQSRLTKPAAEPASPVRSDIVAPAERDEAKPAEEATESVMPEVASSTGIDGAPADEAKVTGAKPDTASIAASDFKAYPIPEIPAASETADNPPVVEPIAKHDLQPVPATGAEATPRGAVLKAGVVDGMGYTLYVDGSIEAELPQGTLHFASIKELREHLEKNP